MTEDILHDIARIRRMVVEAAKEHGNGKDVTGPLGSVADELSHLLEKAESRSEEIERESLDHKTRFVSELAGGFVRSMMARQGHVVTGAELEHAVDMAAEIVKQVKARY
ncbi:MAG: hypothetical protein MI920_12725 [Kiloniellales bacterium]|nr:hypothetical protein [Kiloniellales bacterium]